MAQKIIRKKLIELQASPRKNKKYMALVRTNNGNTKVVHFGDSRYGQYRDSTPIKVFNNLDHGDKIRRRNYFLRFSGAPRKREALEIELEKSSGELNAKILSHYFLW